MARCREARIAFACVLMLLLVACGSDSKPISVSISSAASTVSAGSSAVTITATVANDSKNAGVTWSLSPSTGCGTLASSGATATYTPPSAATLNADCTATITATSSGDSSKSSSISVAIKAISVSLSSSSGSTTTFGAGAPAVTLSATLGNEATGASDSITWNLSSTGNVTPARRAAVVGLTSNCGTLVPNGSTAVYTPPSSLGSNCTATVTAASSINSNRKTTSTFSVNAITLALTTPTSAITEFADNGNVSLTASIANDGANQGVAWSVNGCGTVTPGTPSTTAVYTPPASPAAQCSAVVTATSVTDLTKSASSPTITINPVVGVAFTSPVPSSIAEGATQSLTAAVTNDLGSQGMTWTLSPSGCGTLSATSGTTVSYIAPSTLAAQCSAAITATSVADNRKKASATIGVDLTVVSVTSPGSNLDIPAGRNTDFTATITNDGSGQGISWSLSPSTGCGSISATSGTNIIYTGPVESGLSAACTATVTATSVADSGKTASRQIKSNPIVVSEITTTGGATPPTIVGQGAPAIPLSATIAWDTGSAGLGWSVTPSSCGSLGAVTPSGNTSTTSFVPASSVSSDCAATITALSAANGNRKSTVSITVKPLTVSITTPASTVNVTMGGTQALVASVVGDPTNAGVTWSMNPPMNCGVFSDITTGSATFNAPPVGSSACQVSIIATSKTDTSKTASVTLNVVPPAIVLTLVTPGPWSLNASNNQGMSSRQINVSLQNDTANQGVSWTNSNPSCGSLVPSASDSTVAAFTAGQSGGLTTACETTITARAVADNTKTVSGTMTVTPVSVSLSPNGNQSVTQGGSTQFTATVTNEDPGGLTNFTTLGVAWSLNPSSGCGSLGNSSTTGVTYYAPSSLSQSCNVQLTAMSAADTSKSVSLQITANPPSQPMSFNTSARDVNNGLVGQMYNMYFDVSGGTQPYTFSLASGSLPPGLSLDSTHSSLAGSPTTAGSYTFSVKAQDSASNSVTSPSLTVKVSSAPNHAHDSYLNGRYVCLVKGYNDSDGSGWTSISSIPFTGASTFTGGVFDNKSRGEAVTSGTLTGTVNIGSDNNGIITMTANSMYTTTWAAVLNNLSGSNSTEFHMIEIDDVGTSASGQTGSADCYQANTPAFAASTLSGSSFAFELTGEAGDGTPKALLGRFTALNGSITAGVGDSARGYNDNQQFNFTGTYTTPSSTTGRFTTSFTIAGAGATANSIGYIVDSKRTFIMSADTSDGIHSGIARKQQQTSYSNANMNGNFAVYMQGHKFDATSGLVTGYGADLMQGTGNGSSGFTINQSYEVQAAVDARGSIVVGDQNGTAPGTVDSGGRLTFTPGSSGAVTIYLFDNNTGFIMDSTDARLNVGVVDAQTQTTFTDAAVQGSYAFNRLGTESSSYGGSIGIVTLDSSGNVTGLNDSAGNGYYSWADAISATYSWSSTVLGTIQVSQGGTGVLDCVSITSTKFACIETESGHPNVMVMKR